MASAKWAKAYRYSELYLLYYGVVLKEDLVSDDIANDEFHAQQLMQYFPTALRRNYSQKHMDNHPLRLEIIATAPANQMVNEMGCNFVTRLQEETGANIVEDMNATQRHVKSTVLVMF
ncbi:NAD-glutamate dehydrogenase [Vibrio lentus]|nr:NAD-glutamate dehydrogenase [Vibrio lentus]